MISGDLPVISVPIVDGKYSVECYMMALRGAIEHLRDNLDLKDHEKLFDQIDYMIYHLPFTKMAKKAHRQLIEVEYPELNEANREEFFLETYNTKVKPSILGAQEVGNIYTGSVYMGLISLLETEKEKVEGKNVGIFSYGSGCGAELLICNMKHNIDNEIIKRINFKTQLHRRKKISIDHYTHIYSQKIQDVVFFSEEVQKFKDDFTKFVFTGIKDNKRQYA